jgi:hypothetical protein
MMVHPLVSPLAAPPELWKGMPPVFMCLGNEGLEDEIAVMARRMHQGGGAVELVGYEGMPHCFAMVFPTSAMGQDCFERWAKFCDSVVHDSSPRSSNAVWIQAFSRPPRAEKVALDEITTLRDQEVVEAMKRMQDHAVEREKEPLKLWNEQQSKAKL